MITRFLHTGFEVEDIDQAISFYETLGFSVTKQFDKAEPRAKAAHITSTDNTVIELWQFIDKNHPQVEFICRHIAFESDDLEKDIQKLALEGCKQVIPITKGVTMTYAFLRDPSGNYIEIGQR
jgi:catechol 2,3-dioxygenase-like lactoylglutathione lyase family enzyme